MPKATAGAEPSRRVYELICKDCGAKFGSAGPAARYCPACRKKRTSPPANGRQDKTGDKTEPEGAGKVENSSKTVQEAWDRLGVDANASTDFPADVPRVENPDAARPQENAARRAGAPDPEDMEMDELLRTAADAMRRDTGDMILTLYETIRSVARAEGMEPGKIVQALYELDCVLERAERRNEA